MQSGKSLYYLAIIPPEPVYSEVRALKEYALEHFDSGHALRSPAHITLIPPFHMDEGRAKQLINVVGAFAKERNAFEVTIRNFKSFPPRVIYIDVEENLLLNNLQSELQELIAKRFNIATRDKHRFHPHITIAFRYPNEEVYPKAWAHYGHMEYARKFMTMNMALLIHCDKRWEVRETFGFGIQSAK